MQSNTADSELEWRTLDSWGSISGEALKGNIENGVSRSKRCFQTKSPSEQLYQQNYYAGTVLFTPGPGTYSDIQGTESATSFSFGSSNRALSESGRMWASNDYSVPPPGTYSVDKSSRERYLRDLLGVTRWKIKNLKHKLKVSQSLDASKSTISMITTELELLKQRLRALQQEIQLAGLIEEGHKPTFPTPIKPAFNSTGKKSHQERVVFQEAPTFYLSDDEWDFGADKRSTTTDMSAWNYSTKVLVDREKELLEDTDTLVGARSGRSRCRETDFFGPNKGFRSITPGAGTYHPELLPPKACDLEHARRENGSTMNTTPHWTHKNGKYSFTFSRSSTMSKLEPNTRRHVGLNCAGSVLSELTAPSLSQISYNRTDKTNTPKSRDRVTLSPVKKRR